MATCRQRNCTFMQMFQTPEKKSDVIRDIRESECVMILSIPSDNRSILMSCKMKTSRPRRLSDVPLTSLKRKKKKKEKKKIGRIDKNHHREETNTNSRIMFLLLLFANDRV